MKEFSIEMNLSTTNFFAFLPLLSTFWRRFLCCHLPSNTQKFHFFCLNMWLALMFIFYSISPFWTSLPSLFRLSIHFKQNILSIEPSFYHLIMWFFRLRVPIFLLPSHFFLRWIVYFIFVDWFAICWDNARTVTPCNGPGNKLKFYTLVPTPYDIPGTKKIFSENCLVKNILIKKFFAVYVSGSVYASIASVIWGNSLFYVVVFFTIILSEPNLFNAAKWFPRPNT